MKTGLYRLLMTVLLAAAAAGVARADTAVEDAEELFQEGLGYIQRGYYTLGVEALERAVAANRNHIDALVLLADHIIIDERGVRYASAERNQRARELYERAIDLQPGSPHAHNNLAWLLVQIDQDSDAAIAHAQAALQLRPNQIEYLDTLAAAYCQNGQYGKARETLQQALDLAPEAAFLKNREKKICSREPESMRNKTADRLQVEEYE